MGGRRGIARAEGGGYRWGRAAVQVKGLGRLHIVTFYGVFGDNDEVNHDLLRQVFGSLAGLGHAPWLVVGDFNRQPLWVAADPAVRASGGYVITPDSYTCLASAGQPTLIDFGICSRSLRPALSRIETLQGEELPTHLPIRFNFDVSSALEKVPGLWTPRKLEGAPRQEVAAPDPHVLQVERGSLEDAWASVTQQAEAAVLGAWGIHPSEAVRFAGRGRAARLVRRCPVPRQVTALDGSITSRMAWFVGLARRLRELARIRSQPFLCRQVQLAEWIQRRLWVVAAKRGPTPLERGCWERRLRQMGGVQADTLQRWAAEAEAIYEASALELKESRQRSWETWARAAVRAGGRKACAWINEEKVPPIAAILGRDELWRVAPVAVADECAEAWGELWSMPVAAGIRREVHDARAALTAAAEAEALPPLSGKELEAIARRIPLGKAPGHDGWRPVELRALSLPWWECIAELLTRCESEQRWPEQLRGCVVALLPKPGGSSGALGQRPIGILPLVYRIWAAARKPTVHAWQAGRDEPAVWGCRRGRSAEAAAWEAAAHAEVQAALGRTSASALLDCSKCYERVNHAVAARAVVRERFPARPAQLALDIYGASRFVRVAGATAEPRRPVSGIVAGCGFAVGILQAVLAEPLRVLQRRVPSAAPRTYVDDVALATDGSPLRAMVKLRAGVDVLTEQVHRLGLRFEREKMQIIVGGRGAAAMAKRLFPEVILTIKACGRDLGVDRVGGRVRRVGVAGRRRISGIGVLRRARRLPVGAKLRAGLARAVGVSKALFGVRVMGMARSARQSLRAAVAVAVMGAPLRRRCTTATLALADARLDPAVEVPALILEGFAERLQARNGDAAEWEVAWQRAVHRVAGIGRVAGPLSAAVAALKELRWEPVSPLVWGTPAGPVYPASASIVGVGARARAAAQLECWREAARTRRDLQGAEDGVDLLAVKRLIGAAHPVQRGRMLAVLTGATWPRERLWRAGRVDTPHCSRCGEIDTVRHRWWACPAFSQFRLEHGFMAQGEPMLQGVDGPVVLPSCMLERVMVPAAWTSGPPARQRLAPGEAVPPFVVRGTVYVDGSAMQPCDPRLRRAGWGLT